MTLSVVLRFTGSIIVALSIVVAMYGPSSVVLSFGVGAAAAYGLVLLAGGEFAVRKFIALFSSTVGGTTPSRR
jgi:uncharacterized membrane protein YjjB (DUF3815 family)